MILSTLKLYQHDFTIIEGRKKKLPAYYDRLKGTEDEPSMVKLKKERHRRSCDSIVHRSLRRLDDRHEVKLADISRFKKEL